MPVQTTVTQDIMFPDGCKVYIKPYGGDYTDMGAVKGTVKTAVEWKENQIMTSNAGIRGPQIRDMMINGSFTLINLNLDRIEEFGGGMFEKVSTAASENSSIPDQEIAAGWDDNISYDLEMLTSSSDSTPLKMSTKPALTSVTLDPDGTPEVLVEDTEYVILADADSPSGWAIQFISGNMTTENPKTFEIVIEYAANTPVARTTLYAGTSTFRFAEYALKFEHTDTNGLVRGMEVLKVYPKSGGFNFDFKGADEDGTEEMPITFTGVTNTALTDGRQLMIFYSDTGAE